LTLDLAIGETSQIESTDKGKISEMVNRVQDLHGRLQDIRREQVFQRVSVFGSRWLRFGCRDGGIWEGVTGTKESMLTRGGYVGT
jgi:hypothetical protein